MPRPSGSGAAGAAVELAAIDGERAAVAADGLEGRALALPSSTQAPVPPGRLSGTGSVARVGPPVKPVGMARTGPQRGVERFEARGGAGGPRRRSATLPGLLWWPWASGAPKGLIEFSLRGASGAPHLGCEPKRKRSPKWLTSIRGPFPKRFRFSTRTPRGKV